MSRCSRGRCGWRAGSGCRSPATPSTGRAAADVVARQIPAFHTRTAAPDARYDLGCLYIGVNDVRAPDFDAETFAADHATALAFLRERCDRVLCVALPAGPRTPARRRGRGQRRRAGERSALVLDLRGFGARNLVMTDHVHPTAFGQVWIAERALDVLAADGMDVRVRPSA